VRGKKSRVELGRLAPTDQFEDALEQRGVAQSVYIQIRLSRLAGAHPFLGRIEQELGWYGVALGAVEIHDHFLEFSNRLDDGISKHQELIHIEPTRHLT
jgi:hypothetical protein